VLAIAGVLGGCSALDTRKDVMEAAEVVKRGPEAAPYRSITNFSSALRCMDNLLLDYGVRDVSVIVEDITDQTKKVNAGTKDMLISAVSDMTRRSRAIRLIAYGQDSGNTIGFMHQAENRSLYAAAPRFTLKGSVSQFDETIARKQIDGAVGVAPYVSLSGAKVGQASVLGLDLAMLYSEDVSIVPGTSSRNSVIVFKEGKAVDGDGLIKKFSINFSVSSGGAEGQSQALRTLVELATVELFGRLAKVPYWTCIGADPNDEAVQQEISDWFDALYANPQELVLYAQAQMRARGYYRGPIDGSPSREVGEAIAAYRGALGLPREPKFDLAFFRAYLAANHREVAATLVRGVPVAIAAKSGSYLAGESVHLTVRPERDANVYCYLRDDQDRVLRFFPNRFAPESRVPAARPLDLPGKMRFQLLASEKGLAESVACFAIDRDVSRELPLTVVGTDFDRLPVATLEEVRAAFASVAGGTLGMATHEIQIRK
jgi:hypothetical protein